ncbi:MAG: glutamine synthetase, partial [Candidatus Regiella insecticola]|nr:glutamine synthetase [Candidatus Regiella insecticola]
HLPFEETQKIPKVASSLEEALMALDGDRQFLKRGNILEDETIDAYIALHQIEVERIRMTPHPLEFEMYYSV